MSTIQSKAQAERFQKTQKLRSDKFIEKANTIHNYQYDYSNVLYTHSHTKVNIICSKHGSFLQAPADHVHSKQGCPKCAHSFPITHNGYVAKSKVKYGDKFTIISEFIGIKHPITICCKEHGNFTIKAANHLNHSGGCPKCWYLGKLNNLKPGNISKVEKQWLDSLGVPLRQEKITVGDKIFLVDGFDPTTNTVYEYHGSYWHGNPAKYSPNELNTKANKTFGELYLATIARENKIKQYYNLVTKWGL
jgi:hypothetical protein